MKQFRKFFIALLSIELLRITLFLIIGFNPQNKMINLSPENLPVLVLTFLVPAALLLLAYNPRKYLVFSSLVALAKGMTLWSYLLLLLTRGNIWVNSLYVNPVPALKNGFYYFFLSGADLFILILLLVILIKNPPEEQDSPPVSREEEAN